MPSIAIAPRSSQRRSGLSPSGLRPTRLCWALVLAMTTFGHAFAQQTTVNKEDEKLPEVVVSGKKEQQPTEKTGSYTIGSSNTATGLDMRLRETPQSISVITREKMDDFKLENINQVLANTTGVTVESVETDRTYYTARGFDITNFQFDGVGVPFSEGLQNGDLDTAMYDRIDVLRGANGLMSSTGNPSATVTVNFVRKRPTYDFQASVEASYGSWDTRRINADISGPLNAAGTVAGRLVVAQQDGNSYLARYQPDKTIFYGVIEANLGDHTLLTIGHSNQNNEAKGAMWGALPLYYTDGAPTNYAVGSSTSANWSYWDSEQQRSFAELKQQFDNGWEWKTTLTYNQLDTDGKLFYVYGTPDQNTGLGLYSYPSLYNSQNDQSIIDSHATGKYTLGGRQHDLTFGVTWSRSTLNDISHYGQGIGTALTANGAFDGSYPEPSFNASIEGSSYTDRRHGLYAATRLNLADNLKLLVGANYTDAKSTGISYDVSHRADASATTPYAGVVYDINNNISAYASYTKIFSPQYETDITGATLAPVEGKSYEAGLKSEWLHKKLNASAAIFRVEQQNTAQQAGYIGATAYYEGINAYSEGVELDVSGELAKGWQGSLGYTAMTLRDQDGNSARTFIPRTMLRMATTYQVPQLEKLKIGASYNWQGKTSYAQTDAISTVQQGYGLLSLMASYDISKQLSLHAVLNNVTNEKYISSLYWAQGYYGAPINGTVSIRWQY